MCTLGKLFLGRDAPTLFLHSSMAWEPTLLTAGGVGTHFHTFPKSATYTEGRARQRRQLTIVDIRPQS